LRTTKRAGNNGMTLKDQKARNFLRALTSLRPFRYC
jgi:hypothetical protein